MADERTRSDGGGGGGGASDPQHLPGSRQGVEGMESRWFLGVFFLAEFGLRDIRCKNSFVLRNWEDEMAHL